MDWIMQLRFVLDVAIAMALGGSIGFEREMKNRPAGFRTHMLVAGAAALLVSAGQLVLTDPRFRDLLEVQIDPLRLVEAVVAGVAFIGAGTIFASRQRAMVVGITTAASLLMVAIVGVAVGFRYYALAAASTALTWVVLVVLGMMERKLPSSKD